MISTKTSIKKISNGKVIITKIKSFILKSKIILEILEINTVIEKKA